MLSILEFVTALVNDVCHWPIQLEIDVSEEDTLVCKVLFIFEAHDYILKIQNLNHSAIS